MLVVNEENYIEALTQKGWSKDSVLTMLESIGGYDNFRNSSESVSTFILTNRYCERVSLVDDDPFTLSSEIVLAKTPISQFVQGSVGVDYLTEHAVALSSSISGYFDGVGVDKFVEAQHLAQELPLWFLEWFFETPRQKLAEVCVDSSNTMEALCNNLVMFASYIMAHELELLYGALVPENLLKLDCANINHIKAEGIHGKISNNTTTKDFGIGATPKRINELVESYYFSFTYDTDTMKIDYLFISLKADAEPIPVHIKLKNCYQAILEGGIIQYEAKAKTKHFSEVLLDVGTDTIIDVSVDSRSLKMIGWEGCKCSIRGSVDDVNIELRDNVIFMGSGLKAVRGMIMCGDKNTVILDCDGLGVSYLVNDDVRCVNNSECEDGWNKDGNYGVHDN